jgi:hypothetical protein
MQTYIYSLQIFLKLWVRITHGLPITRMSKSIGKNSYLYTGMGKFVGKSMGSIYPAGNYPLLFLMVAPCLA